MSDIEKDSPKKKSSKKNASANGQEPAAQDNHADQPTVSDLVAESLKGAGAFFNEDLDADAAASNEAVAGDYAPGEMPSLMAGSEQPTKTGRISEDAIPQAAAEGESTEKPKRSKKSKKKRSDDEVISAVEWNPEMSNLDFEGEGSKDETSGSSGSSGDDGKLSAFEALAKRVAETVTHNLHKLEETAQEVFSRNHDDDDTDNQANKQAIKAPHPSPEEEAEVIAAAREAAAPGDDENVDIESLDMAPPVEPISIDEADVRESEAEAYQATPEVEVAVPHVEHVPPDEIEMMATPEGAEPGNIEAEIEAEAFADAAPPTDETPLEQMDMASFSEEMEAAENDADPEPSEFITDDQLHSVIESLLFSTDKPVSVATIKQIFKGSNVRTKDISRALDSLASDYASSTRGVTLEEVGGGYQLRTKSDNAEYLRRLAKVRPFKLSGPALETIAIVAYKQPITKTEIDIIRGVESGHLLRALMERGMVSFGGKSELPGKPMTYVTTRKFLETFGLRNLKELPTLSEIDELIPEGIGETEEKETLSDITDSMAQGLTEKYSEGEEELEKIHDQLRAIDTTTEFFEQEKQRERDRRDADRAQDIRERIVLGDSVEEKDRRWLDRYEAKMAAPAVAEPGAPDAEGAPVEANQMNAEGVSADMHVAGSAEEEDRIADQLEALSEESSQRADASDDEIEGENLDAFIESDDVDDLTANPDYDDDEGRDLD